MIYMCKPTCFCDHDSSNFPNDVQIINNSALVRSISSGVDKHTPLKEHIQEVEEQ